MRYEIIEHTADVGIVAHGVSLSELFENTAYGMFDLMFDLTAIESATTVEVDVSSDDPTELLYRWLSELLYRFEADETVWCTFSVTLDGGLHALLGGASIAAAELRGTPIKAVTRHGLAVQRRGKQWTATVLFDM